MSTTVTRFPSPLGDLVLAASDAGLTAVYFPTSRHGPPPAPTPGGENDILVRTKQQLAEYFGGARHTFELPLAAKGSEFERRVWDLLRTIPYGTTTSYGALARRLGDVRATRAVGGANGKNQIGRAHV